MGKEILKDFFIKYIKGTSEKAIVADRKMLLCRLTIAVAEGVDIQESTRGVYITSRCLKHLFDKKPAEEFFFLIDNLHKITRYPEKIYKNRKGKRGAFCFVKRIGDSEYICSIEMVKEEIQVATAFRLRDSNYIKNYTTLWDWGNGNPHRSALDTPKESTNAPQ